MNELVISHSSKMWDTI